MTELRAIFDEDAERYDRARPGYPAALFDDLAELAGVGPGCRLLEIGPGTGKATVDLARRGCCLVAVELGPNLAAVARANLAAVDAAPASYEVVVSAFETWPLPPEPFDVVLAATATVPAVGSPASASTTPVSFAGDLLTLLAPAPEHRNVVDRRLP